MIFEIFCFPVLFLYLSPQKSFEQNKQQKNNERGHSIRLHSFILFYFQETKN